MFADYTSVSIPLSQVVRGRPRGLLQSLGGRSNALTAQWWSCLESERATWPKKRSVLVLMSFFNDTSNWRAAGSLPDRIIGNVSSIRNPKDFSDRPCVKGIQSPRNSLCDRPRFWSNLCPPGVCVWSQTPGGHRFDTTQPLCRPGYVTSKHASPAVSYNFWQYQCPCRKWCIFVIPLVRKPTKW